MDEGIDVDAELFRLRGKVSRQRAELKRLNKYLGPYWAGFTHGCQVSDAACLRGKMIKAFGHKAVYEAEHAE